MMGLIPDDCMSSEVWPEPFVELTAVDPGVVLQVFGSH